MYYEFIGRSTFEKFEKLLDPPLVDLRDYVDEDEGAFEDRLDDYMKELSDDQVLESVHSSHSRLFYKQILHLRLAVFRAANSESNYATNQPDATIPERYNYCTTHQDYLRQLIWDVEEGRRKVKAVVDNSRSLRDTIKLAAENDALDEKTLTQLKLKMEALQENFRSACLVLGEPAQDLIGQRPAQWW